MDFAAPASSYGASSKSNSSIALVAAPYGRRASVRGITRLTKRASSLSRKLRHLVYSCASKILARSRGLTSSGQLSKPNMPAPAAEMNGANAAAATLETRRSVSTSSGCCVHS